MEKDYEVKNGRIVSKNGIPRLPRWFTDDLVSIQTDEYGVSEIQYFNPKTLGSEKVFTADMWGGIKFFIDDCGEKNAYNFADTVVMPYGFSAVWKYNTNSFKFEQRVLNNSLFISIEPLECSGGEIKLSLEFYDAFCMLPRKDGDFRFVSNVDRVWREWKMKDNVLLNSYCEGDGGTHIAIKSNTDTEYIVRAKGFKKYILNFSGINEKKIIVTIAFDSSETDCIKRADETLNNYQKYIDCQNLRYDNVIKKAPVLKSPYKALNDFFSLAPLYHEANKVLSVIGAVRAKTETYWMWGWDGMSSSYAYAYWGDKDFIEKLLRIYMETADEEKGIGHWFARNMTHIETSMISAQGFYISLLYQYYINGGDITPFYDFAKKIFDLIKSVEVDELGLCSGNSLVPDFREVILENGNDISCFNNTSMYCAVRAMVELSKAMDDTKTYASASEFTKRTRDNFKRILYDDEMGYVVSSADSKTLEKRKVYNAMAVKWDNKFCNDLTQDINLNAVKFFDKNFVCKSGLRPFPLWGIGYDEDANQAHCYWPAHSEYFTRIANRADRKDLIDKFVGWISRWTEKLTCPEGINCYINSAEPFIDKWNANNGTWQSYSMRAWYEAVVHSVVGVDIDYDGLTIYPYSGEELSLEGLHYKDKIINIYMRGCGNKIKSITLNGESIMNKDRVPDVLLKEKNELIVLRTS